jgi:hypothetical protein
MILRDLQARQAIGIHWGVFRLSDEGRDEPRDALARALAEQRIHLGRFTAAEPGLVVVLKPAARRIRSICSGRRNRGIRPQVNPDSSSINVSKSF